MSAANYTFLQGSSGTETITQAQQQIAFPPSGVVYGQADFSPASASSGLAVSYSNPSGQCAIDSAGLVQITGAGSCTITASQAGNADYQAAMPVTQTIQISPATLLVDADNTSVVYGQSPTLDYTLTGFVNNENATSAGVTGAPNCTSTSGSSAPGTYPGAINCTTGSLSAANYTFLQGASGAETITQAQQTISFSSTPPTSPTYAGSYTVTAAGGGSGEPVVVSIDSSSTTGACSISGAKVSFTGTGLCVIDANQAGNADYQAAPTGSQTFTIAKAGQSITFTSTPPTNPTYTGSYTVAATGGGSGEPIVFSIDPSSGSGACSISGAKVSFTGAGSCVVDANQAGNADYQAAPQAQQKLTIVASTLPNGGECDNLAITGKVNGNLTVPQGASCLLTSGTTVTGNVTNAGTLTVSGAAIDGNLQSSGPITVGTGSTVGGNLDTQGGSVAIAGPSTAINGNLQIQGGGPVAITGNPAAGTSYGISVGGNLQVEQLAASTATDLVCAAKIAGNLLWEDNGESVTIGGTSCPGNYVGGNIEVENNALPSGDTTPAATIEQNTIKGNLQTAGNTPKAVVTGNTVSGNTQLS